jgi:hypothetical protein
LLSIYSKCISNYAEQIWDQGAFFMFSNKTFRETQNLIGVPEIRDTFGVSECLVTAKSNGFDNDGCFSDIFLRGVQKSDYFEYSNITDPNPSSKLIDACMVYSGAALHPDPAIAAPFKACLESHANATSCNIPSIVWSGMCFSFCVRFVNC